MRILSASLAAALAACTYKAELPAVADAGLGPAAAAIEVRGAESFNRGVKPQTRACSANDYQVAFAPYAESAIRARVARAFESDPAPPAKLTVSVDRVDLTMRCILVSYVAGGRCTAESAVDLVGRMTTASGATVERRVKQQASRWSGEGAGCERGADAIEAALKTVLDDGATKLATELHEAGR